jgi:asparagine synthase (glutamine-hydrolysing)
MCGILCIYQKNGFNLSDKNILKKIMSNSGKLRHRGYSDNYKILDNKLFMYHNRLAINDVSKMGMQPMMNNDIIIIVNGEIYNYKELRGDIRKKMPSYKFQSNSDSEIIIPLYLQYGTQFIKMLKGMYAFVLYDIKNKRMIASRDHIGIVSFYYLQNSDVIMFSSEMKALIDIDKSNNIQVFKPGHTFINDEFYNSYTPKWKDFSYYPKNIINYEELNMRLTKAVLSHTLSDVPIGILLSGGLDSSLIASIMAKLKRENIINNEIKTYTIGFEESSDIIAADKVVDYIGSDHTTYIFTKEDGLEVIKEIIYYLETYDITTIRASIPMYLLTREIRNNPENEIKVLLSGEGSDELFGGYLYFHKAPNPVEFQHELIDKLEKIHKYDCLRAHKASMSNTIELRVPFLDKDFIDYVMNIDPKYKMVTEENKNIEKYILREAFKDNYLPDEILWRQKDQFSDAVSSKKENWIDSLKEYANTLITDQEFENRDKQFPINTPISKEHYLYRKIFEEHFPHKACIETVDHNIKSIACSTERALKWMNLSTDSTLNDASGRSLVDIYHK